MYCVRRTLGEICDEVGGIIRTGPFGSQLHESDYVDIGIPVVMPKDIVEGKVSANSIAYVSEKDAQRLSQHRLKAGDIVYGRRGDIGRQALITEREAGWLCGTGCLRLSLNNSVIDPSFLHYYLRDASVIKWIANQAIGATLPNLNTTILRSVPVKYPELRIQRNIAGVLSVYDELVQNNARRNTILEEMAEVLYREWFVHFRFPGHEKIKRVDSPLGRIPKGWEVKKLGNAIELSYGRALKQEHRAGGSVPVFGSSGVVGHHDKPLAKGPGIIVGRKGNVGSVFWSDRDFYAIDTVFFVRTELSLPYVFYNLCHQSFNNNDAAVPGLSRSAAYLKPLLIPDSQTLTAFEEIVTSIFKQLRVMKEKNSNLRGTLDILLPKLISGELSLENGANNSKEKV